MGERCPSKGLFSGNRGRGCIFRCARVRRFLALNTRSGNTSIFDTPHSRTYTITIGREINQISTMRILDGRRFECFIFSVFIITYIRKKIVSGFTSLSAQNFRLQNKPLTKLLDRVGQIRHSYIIITYEMLLHLVPNIPLSYENHSQIDGVPKNGIGRKARISLENQIINLSVFSSRTANGLFT